MAAEQLVYDFCVVGGGLWGSACCYHLLKQLPASATIAFIAPSEPVASAPSQHWGWDDQHEGVYSAHYDEGRITRELDSDETWSRLASASIRCYRDIETNSRVSFYTEAGYLCLGTQAQDAYVRKVEAVGKAVRCDFTTLVGATDIQDRFPSLKVDDTAIGLHQARNAGHISPRRLVSALRTVIQQHEPTVLETYATRVDVIDGTAAVQLANGQTLRAQKVIVAPGAFIEASLCNGWQPPVHVSGRTVVLKDVTDLMDDESLQLSTLPSIISCSTPKAPGTPLLYDTYQLPPIMYPDGRWYLKIGTGDFEHDLTTMAEKQAWFKGPAGQADEARLLAYLRAQMPCLDECPHATMNCALTFSSTGYPILDWVPETGETILLAVAGNGGGAKSSLEIGRLAALAALGQWDESYRRDEFRIPMPEEV